MSRKVLATLLLAVWALALAGPTAVKAPLNTKPALLNPATTDAASVLRESGRARDAWQYTMVWKFPTYNILCVGLTPVQDTLIWVSSGGITATSDPNWIYIFDARTFVLLDSFQQATTTDWGYRDMAYDASADVVFAGTDGNLLDVIDATTHAVVGSYTLSGTTPGTVRALAFDGDSLYTANFTDAPVIKFATDGTGAHQVAPVPPYAIYGLAIDRTHNRAFATTADNSSEVILYDLPSWTVSDTMAVPELGPVHGGCEMWRGDTFLIALSQSDPCDSVVCFRVVPSSADVGVAEITAPSGFIGPGTLAPTAVVRNHGSDPQGPFDVSMAIAPGGYASTKTVATLNPGDTVVVVFDDWTPAGSGVSTVACTTQLAGDQNPANDAKSAVAMIATFVLDLEANNGGLTADGGPAPGWEWGVPGAPRPAAHSGTKVWGGALTGEYPTYADWRLVSSTYTATQDTPVVAFWHWYATEARYDGGNLTFSTDGGTTWTVLQPWSEYSAPYDDTVNTLGARGYTGAGPGQWALALFRIPLDSAAGFTLRWRFASDLSIAGSGWVIDDIAGIGFAPVQHDVGCDAIQFPTGIIPQGSYAPVCRVRNYGASTETFDVRLAIEPGGYVSTKTVSALASLDTASVVFDTWVIADSALFALRCSTRLAGDEATNNDARSGMAGVPSFVLDFETNRGSFVAENSPAPGWEYGAPAAPRVPHSGVRVWAGPLSGNYVNDANWKLNSCEYVATADDPLIIFWHWYSFERNYDGGNVKYSTDAGANWTLLQPSQPLSRPYDATMATTNAAIPGEPAYSGADTTWRQAWFTVPVTAGSSFRLRWHMGTDPSVTTYYGWVVDDVIGIGCDALVGIEAEREPGPRYRLSATPNPATRSSAVSYSLARAGKASLVLYDITGSVVATLAEGAMAAGDHDLRLDVTGLARGVYLLRFESEGFRTTRKLVIQ